MDRLVRLAEFNIEEIEMPQGSNIERFLGDLPHRFSFDFSHERRDARRPDRDQPGVIPGEQPESHRQNGMSVDEINLNIMRRVIRMPNVEIRQDQAVQEDVEEAKN